MEDLREYGEQELSLRVLNDEYLYNVCLDRFAGGVTNARKVLRFLDKHFLYTDEQSDELIDDLIED